VTDHRSARIAVAAILLLGAAEGRAHAQTLAVSGSPGLLRVSNAVAGSQPIAVSNSSTTYTVTTPNPTRLYNLTARLSAPMPAGVTLTGTFAAPPGATSLGAIALDATDRNVVTGIPRRTNATLGITYQLSALASAGVVVNSSRTITLTLVQAP
jgi:hypothetical protein